MLRDYTENLVTDSNMEIAPEGSSLSYGLGSWIFEKDSNNKPIEFSSPGNILRPIL
jgi:hypothetical protein